MSTNKRYKDSVFTKLFSETDKLLELYNALSGNNLPPETIVKITTLENALFLDRQNDVSFLIDNKLVILIEHQSTINENMPLRLFIYLARVYEKIIDNNSVYKTKLIKIPKPEFIVLYNGVDGFPDEKILKLSDAFCRTELKPLSSFLELEVKVININKGHNEEIVHKSQNLSGYVEFTSIVRENINNGYSLEQAITTAVKTCINHEILVEFLKDNSSEVINVLFNEFNIEDAKKVWKEEAREEGREEGREQGMIAKAFETAKNALMENLPIPIISKLTGLSEDEINAIKI